MADLKGFEKSYEIHGRTFYTKVEVNENNSIYQIKLLYRQSNSDPWKKITFSFYSQSMNKLEKKIIKHLNAIPIKGPNLQTQKSHWEKQHYVPSKSRSR